MVQDKDADTYTPLDLNASYTIAIIDYYRSGGFYRTLQDCRLIRLTEILSRDALKAYLETSLGGVVPAYYATPQGHITIIN